MSSQLEGQTREAPLPKIFDAITILAESLSTYKETVKRWPVFKHMLPCGGTAIPPQEMGRKYCIKSPGSKKPTTQLLKEKATWKGCVKSVCFKFFQPWPTKRNVFYTETQHIHTPHLKLSSIAQYTIILPLRKKQNNVDYNQTLISEICNKRNVCLR